MIKTWKAEISRHPSLLDDTVEYGLTELGYESIKPEQHLAVQCLLQGENAFVSVPTGFGKSLVYQILLLC